MYLEQLHYLEVLSKYTSLSQAAAALFISQPALSRAISKLEKELGLKLVRCTNNGCTLTEDGKKIVQYAGKISNEVANIYQYASGKNNIGKIYFTSVPSLSDNLIISALSAFQKKYRNRQLIFNFDTADNIMQSLKNNTIDFALINHIRVADNIFPLETDETFHTSLLFSDKALCWMKADHPLANHTTISNDDLNSSFYYSIAPKSHSNKFLPKNHTVLFSESVSLYKNLIYNQNAIIILPRILAYQDPDIEAGKIITKPIDFDIVLDYYFIKRKNKYLSKETDDFINIFLSLLSEYQADQKYASFKQQ